MEEVGIVKEVTGHKAVVVVQKQDVCSACPAGSLCKTVEGGAAIEAINEANAQVGDTVKIIFKTYTYLKGTVLIYGIPALMLIIGAVVGKELVSKAFPGMDPDIISAISGFGLFLGSFFCIRFLVKRFEGKKEYMPVISEILKGEQ